MKRVSKYVNQTKVINGISFTTVSYSKGKLEIKADGFDGSLWCGTQTWKTKENGANVTKRSGFHLESKRFKESFVANEKPSSLLPMIYSPVVKNFLGETLEECNEIRLNEIDLLETVQDVRQWYKKYNKLYHPDFLGRELFPHEKIMFSVITETRDKLINFMKRVDEVFGE